MYNGVLSTWWGSWGCRRFRLWCLVRSRPCLLRCTYSALHLTCLVAPLLTVGDITITFAVRLRLLLFYICSCMSLSLYCSLSLFPSWLDYTISSSVRSSLSPSPRVCAFVLFCFHPTHGCSINHGVPAGWAICGSIYGLFGLYIYVLCVRFLLACCVSSTCTTFARWSKTPTAASSSTTSSGR